MAICEVIKVPIQNAYRRTQACVEIALLPQKNDRYSAPALVELEPTEVTEGMPRVQLLESCEYRYVFSVPGFVDGTITTDHADVFQADIENGFSGRVRPGLYTGTLPVRVFHDDSEVGEFSLEVRSRKLGYLDEYRWMVRDLADQMSEVVMNRFAPTEQQFRVDNTRDSKTLYQRFAFLKSLIGGETFQAALHEIVRRPHVQWTNVHESVHPGKGVKASSSVSRQMAKAGPRVSWAHSVLSSLPVKIDRQRTEVSVDTAPNRFVKFALEQWRDAVVKISDLLNEKSSNPAIDRGIREVQETLDVLDVVLAEELFKEVGSIHDFPADNPVLHKREGYRDVFRAYIQFDVAAKLAWEGGEDVYGAGKRDIGALYEYWVFLKLAEFVSDLCDEPFDFAQLIEAKDNSLNVTLKKGSQCVLKSGVERLGRKLAIELWFNRSFGKQAYPEGSWSKQMRPDYSIRISPSPDELSSFEPVYVHFDAKYRVDNLYELFGGEDEGPAQEPPDGGSRLTSSVAKREDLLKMHAYRDAIRRSAGAYVIYPGAEKHEYRQYQELLPGLGAFALKPSDGGAPVGKSTLMRFVEDVLEHVASQITQHERGRYWLTEIYQKETNPVTQMSAFHFLEAPPADTLVLLGFVKSAEHLDWIVSNGKYNLRADNRTGKISIGAKALACDLVLLSCPEEDKVMLAKVEGEPEIKTQDDMLELGYSGPNKLYYCLTIELLAEEEWLSTLDAQAVEDIRGQFNPIVGYPVTVSWLSFVERLKE